MRFTEGSDDFFNAPSMDVFITKAPQKTPGRPGYSDLECEGIWYKLV